MTVSTGHYRCIDPRLLILACLLSVAALACGREQVQEARTPIDTAAAAAATPPVDSATAGNRSELEAAQNTAAGERLVGGIPTALQHQVLDSARTFVQVIESGNRVRFFAMLADRSSKAVGTPSGGSAEDIWSAAQQTLRSVHNPTFVVEGGSSDSISIRIRRHRSPQAVQDSFDDPGDAVVLHFVLEGGRWKAIYPGLSYPDVHLRK